MEPALVERPLVQGARVGGAGEKRFPAEEEDEQFQPMAALGFGEREEVLVVAGEVEDGRKVNLEELLRDGPGALVVEPPARAIGEDAPAKISGSQVVHAPQVAEHLSRGCDPLPLASGAAVEGPKPALGLDHRDSDFVTPPLLPEAVGAIFHRVGGEQESVGDVLPAPWGEVLLAETCRPAEEAMQDGPDQVVLGLALVGGVRGRKTVECRPERGIEVVELRIVELRPIGRLDSGLGEEIAGEQTALEYVPDTHARMVPKPDLSLAEPTRDANGLRAGTIHDHVREDEPSSPAVQRTVPE